MAPPFVFGVIAISVIVYLLQDIVGGDILVWFALWPQGFQDLLPQSWFRPWQLFTYSLLHGDLTHLLLNMLAVWMFGSALENLWGAKRLVLTWVMSVLTGALAQMLVAPQFGGGEMPVIGASGGVFGLMLAYAMAFPHARIMLIIPPIPLPARVFVLLYAIAELVMGSTGLQQGVAHFAHLGGLVGGWLGWRHGAAIMKRLGIRP